MLHLAQIAHENLTFHTHGTHVGLVASMWRTLLPQALASSALGRLLDPRPTLPRGSGCSCETGNKHCESGKVTGKISL